MPPARRLRPTTARGNSRRRAPSAIRTAISGRSLAHRVGHHAVQAGRRQQQRHEGEGREHAPQAAGSRSSRRRSRRPRCAAGRPAGRRRRRGSPRAGPGASAAGDRRAPQDDHAARVGRCSSSRNIIGSGAWSRSGLAVSRATPMTVASTAAAPSPAGRRTHGPERLGRVAPVAPGRLRRHHRHGAARCRRRPRSNARPATSGTSTTAK